MKDLGEGAWRNGNLELNLVGEEGKHLWGLEGAEVAVGKTWRQSSQQKRSLGGWSHRVRSGGRSRGMGMVWGVLEFAGRLLQWHSLEVSKDEP